MPERVLLYRETSDGKAERRLAGWTDSRFLKITIYKRYKTMIEKQGNYDSCDAQEVLPQSEFLRRVHDFAEYMQKEYIAESDGEMSLFISAGDSTLGENGVGRVQCVMGQQWMVASGLASWLEDDDHREIFHQARRMADDYDDLPQRRKELCRQRRVLYTLMTISALWACAIILFQVFGISNWIATVSNLLLMTFIGLQLWTFRADLKRKLARFREDESDHRRNMIERGIEESMRRFFSKFHREQDDDEE
jgi:hypothetical protein